VIPANGEAYRFTGEDERVALALAMSGYMMGEDQFSILGIVNAARAFERNRLADAIDALDPASRVVLWQVKAWLREGALTEED
jgi:hypothetical protein